MKRIPLTQGYFAIVDDEDYARVRQIKWWVQQPSRQPSPGHNPLRYALGRPTYADGTRHLQQLGRFILGLLPGDSRCPDHKNGDPLDNRRENLRAASRSQNMQNRAVVGGRSRFKGVYWCKSHNRWRANLKLHGKSIRRLSMTEEHAAMIYDDLAREHFGEFARLNFPKVGERGLDGQLLQSKRAA